MDRVRVMEHTRRLAAMSPVDREQIDRAYTGAQLIITLYDWQVQQIWDRSGLVPAEGSRVENGAGPRTQNADRKALDEMVALAGKLAGEVAAANERTATAEKRLTEVKAGLEKATAEHDRCLGAAAEKQARREQQGEDSDSSLGFSDWELTLEEIRNSGRY